MYLLILVRYVFFLCFVSFNAYVGMPPRANSITTVESYDCVYPRVDACLPRDIE